MLHIVNKSPFSHSCLADCLRLCDAQASILLIEDGVYAALANSEWASQMIGKADHVYVLAGDSAARGLTDKMAADIIGVDYAGFVQLCCDHHRIYSWY